jgi:mono/diheme cytochrome c family protein
MAMWSCFSLEDNSGKASYTTYCASCHGETGKGFQMLIPPLDQADYVKNNSDRLACIIKYGMDGAVTVNGSVYDQAMAGISDLPPEEITNIMNFMVSEFGAREKKFSLKEVRDQLSSCE